MRIRREDNIFCWQVKCLNESVSKLWNEIKWATKESNLRKEWKYICKSLNKYFSFDWFSTSKSSNGLIYHSLQNWDGNIFLFNFWNLNE